MCEARGLCLGLLSLLPAMYGVLCAANYLAMPPGEPELLVATSEFRPNLPPLRPVGVAATSVVRAEPRRPGRRRAATKDATPRSRSRHSGGDGRRHSRPAPPRAAASNATASPSAGPIDVCFLALGAPTQIDASVSIIRNIEAHASLPVRYHLLVDRPRKELRTQMHARSAWRGVPKRMVHLHSVKRISESAKGVYKMLASTATGPGGIYLYKPLLHLLLPEWVGRLIVLDTDVFFFDDVRGLWDEFSRFRPGELLGVAEEQCPSYQETRALGGLGVNGGVQLLALDAMRASRHYASLLSRYAAAGPAWRRKEKEGPKVPPMKPGGIGWLGDQTLYSWMSVNGTGGRQVFHLIPCGWNRQIGTHMAGWPGFWQRHRCDSACHLLHGNFIAHKKFVEHLKADPSGRQCAAIVREHRATDKAFRRGSPDAKMLDVVERCCVDAAKARRQQRPARAAPPKPAG